jgi:hypothetical protein
MVVVYTQNSFGRKKSQLPEKQKETTKETGNMGKATTRIPCVWDIATYFQTYTRLYDIILTC